MSLTEDLLPAAFDCDERDWWRDGQPLTEGWDGAVLRVVLPVPPPDNHCHASRKGGGRYPVDKYTDWIAMAGSHLRDVLGEVQPDTEHWWRVWIRLWFPTCAGDPQNRVKPLLDLLSGARMGTALDRDSRGRSLRGKIVKPGLLWNDDKRCELREVRLMAVQAHEPRVELVAALGADAPVNEMLLAREAAKAQRAAERELRRLERAAPPRRSRAKAVAGC